MRPIVLTSALLAALAISATAHAAPPPTSVDFTFSLDGGPPLSFTLDPANPTTESPGVLALYNSVRFSDGSTGNNVEFIDPAFAMSKNEGEADFALVEFNPVNNVVSVSDFFTGPQLYTGDESDPIFTPGTYTLSGDPLVLNTPATETIKLTISAVPEPSSLMLFGTGVLGCAGALRRRFLKA